MSKATALPQVSNIRPSSSTQGVWSEEEHDRFLEAMKLFPKGPWKNITAHVGTRSVRQVQTHAQKYYEKVDRRTRGLRKERKRMLRPEHRLDQDSIGCFGGSSDQSDSESSAMVSPMWMPTRMISAEEDPCKTEYSIGSLKCEAKWTAQGQAAYQGDDGSSEFVRAGSLADLDDYCLDYLIRVLGVDDDCEFENVM